MKKKGIISSVMAAGLVSSLFASSTVFAEVGVTEPGECEIIINSDEHTFSNRAQANGPCEGLVEGYYLDGPILYGSYTGPVADGEEVLIGTPNIPYGESRLTVYLDPTDEGDSGDGTEEPGEGDSGDGTEEPGEGNSGDGTEEPGDGDAGDGTEEPNDGNSEDESPEKETPVVEQPSQEVPVNEQTNGNGTSNTDNQTNVQEGQRLPDTATNNYNVMLMGAAVILAGGILFLLNRKRQEA